MGKQWKRVIGSKLKGILGNLRPSGFWAARSSRSCENHLSGNGVNQDLSPTIESDVDPNSERREYQGPCHPFPVKEWGWASMSRLARLTSEFLKKMENNATTEANRLRKSNHGKLRLIGTTIGIIVVILVAIWMARR